MNEREWLDGEKTGTLIAHAKKVGSERKLRLFALACCRRIEHLLVDKRSVAALAALENYIEGKCTSAELEHHCLESKQAVDAIEAPLRDEHGVVRTNAQSMAACAVKWAVNSNITPQSAISSVALWSSGSVTSVIYDRIQVRIAEFVAAERAETLVQCQLIRDICGNPFRRPKIDSTCLEWRDGTIIKLAQTIYLDQVFDELPILADALEEAGCTDADVMSHCRGPRPHVRGCWVVDLILGKA